MADDAASAATSDGRVLWVTGAGSVLGQAVPPRVGHEAGDALTGGGQGAEFVQSLRRLVSFDQCSGREPAGPARCHWADYTQGDFHLQYFISLTRQGQSVLAPGLERNLANEPYYTALQT